MRVLIVEDEAILAMDLEILLVEQGYDVCDVARDADEALMKAALHRPDITLMDIRLAHGTNGIDAAKRIRELLGIPSIFVTGRITRQQMEALCSLKPAGFLSKPVGPSCLQTALRRAADRHLSA